MAEPLVFESVSYWSSGDESAFFSWLDSIGAVSSYRGEGTRLLVELSDAPLTAADHEELLALHRRYGVDERQLQGLIVCSAGDL